LIRKVSRYWVSFSRWSRNQRSCGCCNCNFCWCCHCVCRDVAMSRCPGRPFPGTLWPCRGWAELRACLLCIFNMQSHAESDWAADGCTATWRKMQQEPQPPATRTETEIELWEARRRSIRWQEMRYDAVWWPVCYQFSVFFVAWPAGKYRSW